MSETYPSTMGLSVYNVLSLSCADMSAEAVDAFLRSAFDQDLPIDYVAEGVAFLKERELVHEDAGILKIERLTSGRGKPVVRSADDRELVRAAY